MCRVRAALRVTMQSAKLVSGPINHMRRCRHGFMLYNCNDFYIGRSLDVYGEWSEGEIELFRQIVRPGDTAVDGGAFIGTHALALSHIVGPHGMVLAFEPQRQIFQLLCANMALNSVTNVRCFMAALGAEHGTVNVPVLDVSKSNNFGGLPVGTNHPGDAVEMLPVDAFKLASCRLIKVDVEGMELNVLKGAAKTIDSLKPCLYVENDRAEFSDALTRHIDSLGYEIYWHMPPLFNPRNYFQNSENVFGNTVSANLICLHPSWRVKMEGFRRTFPGEPSPFAR